MEHQNRRTPHRPSGTDYVRRPLFAVRSRLAPHGVSGTDQHTEHQVAPSQKHAARQRMSRLLNGRIPQTAFLLLAAMIIVASDLIPGLSSFTNEKSYDSTVTKGLVDATPQALQQKLSYDKQKQTWQFNQNAVDELPGTGSDAAKIGGLAYSAELPTNLSSEQGLTLTDARNKISLGFNPRYSLASGRVQDGYATYPILGQQGQLVYTFEHGGVKENIVLRNAPGETANYRYRLNLPEGLEARLQQDGSIGIFGGNQNLYSNITYGSDKDKALVEKARKNSKKTELYYTIPAPEINGDTSGQAKAHFTLQGNELTVGVTGLAKAHYPLSIDPTFVMDTSGNCSWRKTGNNEANVDYTSCQLSRSKLTGGTVGSWTASTSAATGHLAQTGVAGFVAYNGYLYAASSATGSGAANSVYYAPINASTGAVGQFVQTSSTIGDRRDAGFVAANGYLYAIGGINVVNTTEYALICTGPGSNPAAGCGSSAAVGSLGTWTSASTLNVGRIPGGVAVYNDRIYVISGCSAQALFCTGYTNVTEYATIRGDGSLSTWTQSTSAATGHLPESLVMTTVVVNSGYLYTVGGQNSGSSVISTIYYVPIKNDGSVGAWANVGVSLPVNLRGPVAAVSNNYLYVMGGNRGGDSTTTQNITYLAKIYADGRLGPVQQTTSFTTARTNMRATAYNSRIYISGGQNGYDASPTFYQETQYTTISTTLGDISPFATESDTIPNTNGGVNMAATVMSGGYMYLLGGNDIDGGNGMTNVVRYAKLNSDGSTGAWATTSSFTDARSLPAAAAYNGYMYIAGGNHNGGTTNCIDRGVGTDYCIDIQYAPINSDGTLGTWNYASNTSSNPYPGSGGWGRNGLGMAMYNGYVYVIGGNYNNNSSTSTEVDVAPINADGTVGTWVQNTTALGSLGRSNFQLAQMGPYVYIAGSRAVGSGGGNTMSDVVYATLSSSGGMSAWASAGPDFTTARAYNVAAASNGYLYISTGEGSGWNNDVQYIKINMSTGALSGSWTTSSVTVTNGRSGAQGGIFNGYLYIAGGCQSYTLQNCNSAINNVQYAQIHNDGGGAVFTGQANTTSVVNGRKNAGAIAYNGYMYVLGGSTSSGGTNNNTVEYAPINADGTLGTFNLTSSYNSNSNHPPAFTFYNGYMYKLGGYNNGSGNFLNDVQYAAVCTGTNTTTAFATNCTTSSTPGTLSSWAYTANSVNNGTTQSGGFNTARSAAEAVTYDGYIYLVGGCSVRNGLDHKCTGWTNTLEGAALNADGTVGAWTQSGSTFATGRSEFAAAVQSGYLYIMGGCTGVDGVSRDCNAFASDVQYSKLNSGSLASDAGCGSAWCQTISFHKARYAFDAVVANGYVYVIGGTDGSGVRNDVQYAPIFANATLGNWNTQSSAFTTARMGQASTIENGRLYAISGCTNTVGNCSSSGLISDVQYMGLMSTAAIARHSMLLTTDKPTNPANYFTTTSKQSGTSSINVAYATAASTASPAFGSYKTNNDIRLPSPTKYPVTISADGAQYYMLYITLDDTKSVVFAETAGSNMSYLQLNYHPNPSMRLRGGKTFNSNKQQSLDAP